jgi:hypothetical protein
VNSGLDCRGVRQAAWAGLSSQISAKAFLSNTDDGKDSFSTSGFGLTLGLGTHPPREKVQSSDEE